MLPASAQLQHVPRQSMNATTTHADRTGIVQLALSLLHTGLPGSEGQVHPRQFGFAKNALQTRSWD